MTAWLSELFERIRPRNQTVRGRLVFLYGTVSFFSGLFLLAITYFLVDRALPIGAFRGTVALPVIKSLPSRLVAGAAGPATRPAVEQAVRHLEALLKQPVVGGGGGGFQVAVSPPIRFSPNVAVTLFDRQRVADLNQFLVGAGIALALMTFASVLVGRFFAGRVLQPIRTITDATLMISEENLDRRLSLAGPRDELRELSDTIDGLLGRLEAAFASERTFVANAAHELRTPLAVERSILQVALADPDLTLDSLRQACEEVLEAGRHQEELIEALLTLARSQRGIDHSHPVDLGDATSTLAQAREAAASQLGIQLQISSTGPVEVLGDRHLLGRLVANLVDNALRYNHDGGTVHVRVGAGERNAFVQVENSGPNVPSDDVPRLLRPFQRLAHERTGSEQSLGLGLSIVEAIARAHGAELRVVARDEGGLIVTVIFRTPPRSAKRVDREPQSDESPPSPGGN